MFRAEDLQATTPVQCRPLRPRNDRRTALHVAVEYERVSVAPVSSLLEHGADVNAWVNWRKTPLLGIVKNGRLKAARLLVEHGMNIDAEGNDGRTAFTVVSERYRDDAKSWAQTA